MSLRTALIASFKGEVTVESRQTGSHHKTSGQCCTHICIFFLKTLASICPVFNQHGVSSFFLYSLHKQELEQSFPMESFMGKRAQLVLFLGSLGFRFVLVFFLLSLFFVHL